jgi:hypothetical protein
MSPYDFVCLEHNNTVLYAEVIQVLVQQQRYWARPVLLCESQGESESERTVSEEGYDVYDVRHCSDLIWPKARFRRAFDTELIPLLKYLTPEAVPTMQGQPADSGSTSIHLARFKLNAFIQDLWKTDTHPHPFEIGGMQFLKNNRPLAKSKS